MMKLTDELIAKMKGRVNEAKLAPVGEYVA